MSVSVPKLVKAMTAGVLVPLKGSQPRGCHAWDTQRGRCRVAYSAPPEPRAPEEGTSTPRIAAATASPTLMPSTPADRMPPA